jgi:DNA-binding response OmpR family regulator
MAGTDREPQIRKVMIIEDEHDILHLYKDFLSTKGLCVVVTSTTANGQWTIMRNISLTLS